MGIGRLAGCAGAAMMFAGTAWADLVSEPETSYTSSAPGFFTLVIVAIVATAVISLSVLGISRIRRK